MSNKNSHKPCQYCGWVLGKANFHQHEATCYLNPVNKKLCSVCNEPIKNYRNKGGTCSHACSNKKFRQHADHPDSVRTITSGYYAAICWRYHERKCVVCGEDKVVAAHHHNEDHSDNRPENFVPLCPTHHLYIQSKHRQLIIDIVEEYVKKFISNMNSDD